MWKFLQRFTDSHEAHLISLALGEPPRVAHRIAKSANKAARKRRCLYEKLAVMSREQVLAQVAEVEVSNTDRLIPATRSDRSAVVLMMHMGPFYLAMFKLVTLLPNRNVMIIKAEGENPIEKAAYGHMSGNFPSFDLLRHADPATGRRAVKGLRSGAYLSTFADLPPGFGPTLSGELFGKPALLSCGPVRLAALATVPVIPCCSILDPATAKPRLLVGHPIEVARDDSSITRATHDLWRQLESWISEHPDQWQLWPILARCWTLPDSKLQKEVTVGD